ncbi:hypothetical protein ABQW55_022645 [Xanthomonas citri pv. malvacearum]|uniref:hypothetical protein n=1 Tax=Xanthomonas TaxID=338 RepID=UPI000F796E16|nr:hypothetical protein [Xanthomonas citri]MBE0316953.1 hypothetical protein [Xanthomonas citri pv. punicae]MCC4629835.1 hypothetical protein [Xanthomonas citri]MDS0759658.1 hypothetical protein [Xanthomonas citri pv. punicae]MDS0763434.1 hypothetical protein [Xanthomonas citri pv. punicae]MDS0798205.1 hypothetical protein [Xanthomonas citri pv. punicae]
MTFKGKLKLNKLSILAATLSFSVLAATTITIDGRRAPYRDTNNISGTDVSSMEEIRIAGLTAAAALYRLNKGLGQLPAGARFRMIWPNGSSEGGMITNTRSSMGAVPLPSSSCNVLEDCPALQPI